MPSFLRKPVSETTPLTSGDDFVDAEEGKVGEESEEDDGEESKKSVILSFITLVASIPALIGA